jgi:hypothetical protein
MLVEGIEAGIGQSLRISTRRPREGVGRNTPVDQLGVDGVERGAVEVDEMPLAIVLNLDALLTGVGRQVHDLAVGVVGEPRIIDGHVPLDDHDHVLAFVLRATHLAAAFLGDERLKRREQ